MPCPPTNHSLFRDERGQALPLIALVMFALVGMIYVAYGLGKIVNARIQFQNGADAAALAAVAMKANVHNLRTLSYTAMSLDAVNARANTYAGLAVLAQILANAGNCKDATAVAAPAAGSPPADLCTRYQQYSDRAFRYTLKIQEESAVLDGFNKWAANTLPSSARQAAQIGYLSNIQGVNEFDQGPGADAQAFNLKVLSQDSDLPENGQTLPGGQYDPGLGGIDFEGETARLTGNSGMTRISIQPQVGGNSTSMSLLQEVKTHILATEAIAHVAASDDLQNNDRAALVPGGVLTVKWYSPRLRSLGDQS